MSLVHSSTAVVLIERTSLRRTLLLFAVLVALTVVACGGGGGDEKPAGGGPGGGPPAPSPTIPGAAEILDLTARTGATPGAVVLRFTAPGPGDLGAVTAYEIRAQIRHITPENAASATLVANAGVHGAPGSTEVVTVGGLEPGQTLQFVVRAIHADGAGPFSHGAGARVKDAPAPAPPGNAILLSGPATLTIDGAVYVLTTDISVPGTAFVITGRGVTLDLGGHTVTYGTADGVDHGVDVSAPRASGTTTVTNGQFVQSASNNATYSHGVSIGGGHAHRVSHLTITTQGRGAFGVYVGGNPSGLVRIDHCTVHCNVTDVPNRHYPGVAAIYCEGVENAIEIDHNLITASPQWGIKLESREGLAACLVHHNRIVGTKARVANGYMIGVYRPDCEVFENLLMGESRGIHIDGAPSDGLFGHGAKVHANAVSAQDQPNAEFDPHWCHGIKIEQPDSAEVHHNRVTVLADAAHSEARALDIDVETGGEVVIHSNRIDARSTHGPFDGKALHWTGGSIDVANQLVLRHNVFRGTDFAVYRSWHSDTGGTFCENVWLRDLSKGVGNAFVFERWQNQDGEATPGHRFLDPFSTEDLTNVSQWVGAGPYASTREATLSVSAHAAGAPVVGASVEVRDRQGQAVWSAATSSTGIAAGVVVVHRITDGPAVDYRGPFAVTVNRAGVGSFAGPVVLERTGMLVVDLPAGTAALDTTTPPAPTAAYAVPLSATRVVVRWSAPATAERVVRYLVSVGGEIDAVTDLPECVLSGLAPATTLQVTVQSVDAGGNVSDPTAPIAVTTPADDRGP